MAYVYAGRYAEVTLDSAGRVLPLVSVYVYLRGTATSASLYTSRTKATAAVNPVVTDSRGNLTFFADPGDLYDLVAVVGGVAQAPFSVEISPDPSEFFQKPAAVPVLTGAKAGNTALASVIAALVTLGFATDSTT